MKCVLLCTAILLFSEVAMALDPGECFARQLIGKVRGGTLDRVVGYTTNLRNERFIMIQLNEELGRHAVSDSLIKLLKNPRTRGFYQRLGYKLDLENGVLYAPDPQTLNRFLARAYPDTAHLRVSPVHGVLQDPEFLRVFAAGRFSMARAEPFFHEVIDHMPAYVVLVGKPAKMIQARAKTWAALEDFIKGRGGGWPDLLKKAVTREVSRVASVFEGSSEIARVLTRAQPGTDTRSLAAAIEDQLKPLVGMDWHQAVNARTDVAAFFRRIEGDPTKYGFRDREQAQNFIRGATEALSGIPNPSASRSEVQTFAEEILGRVVRD